MIAIFEYTLEKELQEYIINNFGKYFDFNYLYSEYKIPGGIIDIVGESKDNETIYIIELKRDFITDKTIKQLSNYLIYMKDERPNRNIIGIAAAPCIDNDIDKNNIPNNIELFEIVDVKCTYEYSYEIERKTLGFGENERELYEFCINNSERKGTKFATFVKNVLREEMNRIKQQENSLDKLIENRIEEYCKNHNIRIS